MKLKGNREEEKMTQNRVLAVSGLAIGGLFGGVAGAVIGGVIGSILEEIIYCPNCGSIMRLIANGLLQCPRCKYTTKRKNKKREGNKISKCINWHRSRIS
jgi:ribosomal protein S27AE